MKPAGFLLSALALLSAASPAGAASVTVHSNGSTGDYSSIAAALAAVQGESAGPGNPDVITILDKGPFREPLLSITGDAHDNDLVIRAAPGVRPILLSTSTGANAIELVKNGRAEIRDLIIMPATGLSQPAQRAILYDNVNGSPGYHYHLENILITSNNGHDQPLASLDGLENPGIPSLNHVSFRGGGGVHGNSTDTSGVYRVTTRKLVVSALTSPTPYGFRTFHDGAAGSELVIGEGSVFSYIRSTTDNPLAAAINIGGMEGTPNIGTIQGSEGNPVLIINNRVHGLWLTGGNPESNIFRNVIIANNAGDGIYHSNPRMDSVYENVTVAGNQGHALLIADNNRVAIAFEGSITGSNMVFAGNGSNGVQNILRTAGTGSGTITLNDCALVTFGPWRLNRFFYANGINGGSPSNVTLNGHINADPGFTSLDARTGALARIETPDYGQAGPGGTPLRGGGAFGAPAGGDPRNWYFRN